MRRAIGVSISGTWSVAAAIGIATLDHDDRHRRRVKLKTDAGEPFLLDLSKPARLADGDGLKLDDGTYILVRSANEACVLVRCPDPEALIRVAWHLGNRHLPVQILPEGILIRDDHVIVAMIRGLGAIAEPLQCPFDPEAGAYSGEGHNHHGHDHDDHDHDHGTG